MGVIKGYKILTADMKALINRYLQYEFYKVYKYDEELKLCASGYHWSNSVFDAASCFKLDQLCLFMDKHKCYEVEIDDTGGIIFGVGKNVSDNIRITAEIPLDEVLRLYDEDLEIEEELSTKGMSKREHNPNFNRFFAHLFFRYGYSDRCLHEEFIDLVESDFTKEILTKRIIDDGQREIFLEQLYQFISSYFDIHNTLFRKGQSQYNFPSSFDIYYKDEIVTACSLMYKSLWSLYRFTRISIPRKKYEHLRFARHLKEGDDKDE